jgi:hypothetical protein
MANIGELIADSLDTHKTQLIEDMTAEDGESTTSILNWMQEMLDNDDYNLNVLTSDDGDFHELLKAFVLAQEIDLDFYDNHIYDIEAIWAISIYLANQVF